MSAFITSVPVSRDLLPRSGSHLCACRPHRVRQQRFVSALPSRLTPTSSNATQSAPPSVSITPLGALLFASALIWTAAILPIMLLLHPILLLLRRTRVHVSLLLLWMRMTLTTCFLNISVTGSKNLPQATSLIVANMQSPLDLFVLSFLSRPFLVIAPERARKAPIFGWMLRLAGAIFVPATRRGQMQALTASVEALKAGNSVAMFPEATPSGDGIIQRFLSPVFSVARKALVPIVPVTIHGTFRMFENGVIPTTRPKQPISLQVHEPILADADDRKTAQIVYDCIRKGLPEHLRGDA